MAAPGDRERTRRRCMNKGGEIFACRNPSSARHLRERAQAPPRAAKVPPPSPASWPACLRLSPRLPDRGRVSLVHVRACRFHFSGKLCIWIITRLFLGLAFGSRFKWPLQWSSPWLLFHPSHYWSHDSFYRCRQLPCSFICGSHRFWPPTPDVICPRAGTLVCSAHSCVFRVCWHVIGEPKCCQVSDVVESVAALKVNQFINSIPLSDH